MFKLDKKTPGELISHIGELILATSFQFNPCTKIRAFNVLCIYNILI